MNKADLLKVARLLLEAELMLQNARRAVNAAEKAAVAARKVLGVRA